MYAYCSVMLPVNYRSYATRMVALTGIFRGFRSVARLRPKRMAMNKWVPPVEKPLGMKKSVERIRVVSGVAVVDRRRIFLAQRDPARSDFGYCWETPGGKNEHEELDTHALEREWREELEIDVEVLEHLAAYDFDPPVCRNPVRVEMYRVRLDPYDVPKRRQVLGFGWFTLDEALALELTPSTNAFLLSPVGRGLFA